MIQKEGLSAVKGFQFSGVNLDGNKKNMGIVYSVEKNTIGTAVYTRSDVKAAPVIVSMNMDKVTYFKRAVLINSGTANAFTGRQGLIDANDCLDELAKYLEIKKEECYIASTGVIGQKLDRDMIIGNICNVVGKLSVDSADDFVKATMTTDTRMKQASVSFELDGVKVNIGACVKGSGMIMPDMATMLSTVVTDVSITHEMLEKALKDAVEDTFNCITVDGDTSTNDTVFLLANHTAGNKKIEKEDENYKKFYKNLYTLLEYMAKEVVNDGEGITKFITIDVLNTPDKEMAKKVAMSIANSPLVKTAIFGEDLNWGRILMAIGKAKTGMNCNIIDIHINGFNIIEDGEPVINETNRKEIEKSVKNRNIDISVNFKQGSGKIRVWTCDFSYDYVKINADYTT